MIERIIEEARSWIGTPFYPHVAIKGVGADCVTFALRVFQSAGAIPESQALPEYSLDGGSHLQESAVTNWLAATGYFHKVQTAPGIGDVITFKVGRVDHHVGIVVAKTKFVHCIRRYGVVESDLRDETWSSRLKSIWRPFISC